VAFAFASALVRDCWALRDLGPAHGAFAAEVAAHDTLVFVLAPVHGMTDAME
jgi:hypothetical protein